MGPNEAGSSPGMIPASRQSPTPQMSPTWAAGSPTKDVAASASPITLKFDASNDTQQTNGGEGGVPRMPSSAAAHSANGTQLAANGSGRVAQEGTGSILKPRAPPMDSRRASDPMNGPLNASSDGDMMMTMRGVNTYSVRAQSAAGFRIKSRLGFWGSFSAGGRGGGKTWRGGPKSILMTPEKRAEIEANPALRRSMRRRRVHFRIKESDGVTMPLFDPTSRAIQAWKAFMTIPLVYEHWAFPFRLALESPSVLTSLFVVDVLVDTLIVCDMCVELWTMVPLKPTAGAAAIAFGRMEEKEVVWDDSISGVWKHYFTRVFPIEILPGTLYYAASFAFSDATNVSGEIASASLWLWWASTLGRFVPRSRKLLMWWETLKTNLEVQLKVLQVLKFTVIIFMACHWVGCFFWWIARINQLDGSTWVSYLQHTLPLYDRFDSDVGKHYIICLYRGVNAMTSLGLSLWFPNNWIELLFCLFVMILQVWLSGLILGTLFHYLGQKDIVSEKHKELLEDLTSFCESKMLPPELRERIIRHVEFQHRKRVENKSAGSLTLPRSLAIKVANVKFREIMDMCTGRNQFLCGCNPQFISALMLNFKVHYLMLGEEIVKKDDASRELVFVFHGAAHVIEEDRVKRVVRSDVPGHAPVLAPEVFFFGLRQPNTIRARLDGEVQVLVLGREVLEELFEGFPEEQERIISNLLSSYGLDSYGREVAGTGAGDGGDDPDQALLKVAIVSALRRRVAQMSSSLGHAANTGDVEEVRKLLRQGADINFANYDGRTVLHTSCAQGNYKVAEVLLENGAERNAKNRWGQTPLSEAIENHQTAVVELLVHWKASIDAQDCTGKLCDAASQGDFLQVRQLVENGVDPDIGDYDKRTALHLASAENKEQIVEFLISKKANVNARDRWGGTPLQDAITQGHMILASLISSKGGEMPEETGATSVCTAAGDGDVRTVRLLYECGVDVEIGDYDDRFPMHLAAAEARVLVVSYLLGISANPNCKDRWGATPLDDALRGGTPYHMYCAKLIAGWGGKVGVLKGTAEGKRLVAEMDHIDIEDVRGLIKRLIASGHDKTTPNRPSERHMMAAWESSMELIERSASYKDQMVSASAEMRSCLTFLQSFHSHIRMHLTSLCRIIDSDPRTQKRRKNASFDSAPRNSPPASINPNKNISIQRRRFDSDTVAFAPPSRLSSDTVGKTATAVMLHRKRFDSENAIARGSKAFESTDGPAENFGSKEDLDLTTQTQMTSPKAMSSFEEPGIIVELGAPAQIVVPKPAHPLQDTENAVFGAKVLELGLDAVFDEARDENEKEALFSSMLNMDFGNPIDSDEEIQLHAELDALVEVQEKMEQLGMDLHKYVANVFQKYALRITELEQAYHKLSKVFHMVREERMNMSSMREVELSDKQVVMEELGDVLKMFASVPAKEDSIETMFDDYLEAKAAKSAHAVEAVLDSCEFRHLLGGSSTFRHFLLNIPTDDMYCQLVETRLRQCLKSAQLKLLASTAQNVSVSENQYIISPAASKAAQSPLRFSHNKSAFSISQNPLLDDSHWFVLLSGKAIITPLASATEATSPGMRALSMSSKAPVTIGPGDIFGVLTTLAAEDEKRTISVRTVTACTVVAIPLEEAELLMQTDPSTAAVLRTLCSDLFDGPGKNDPDVSQSGTGNKSSEGKSTVSVMRLESLSSPGAHGASTGQDPVRSSLVKNADAQVKSMGQSTSMSRVPSLPASEGGDNIVKAAFAMKGNSTFLKGYGRSARFKKASMDTDSSDEVPAVDRFTLWLSAASAVEAEGDREEISLSVSDRKDFRALSELSRYGIKSAFKMVAESWNYISMGGGSISHAQLTSLGREMGEAGSELFKELFSTLDPADTVSENAYWKCWASFLDKTERDGIESRLTGTVLETQSQAQEDSGAEDNDENSGAPEEAGNVDMAIEEPQSWFERMHASLSPARSIKHMLYSDQAAERYEDAYIHAVGDFKLPIKTDNLPKFIEHLLPDYTYRISARNINEILHAFGRDNQKGRDQIVWSGIRKGLEDQKKRQTDNETDVFIGSALNSSSLAYRRWVKFVGFLSIYHFIMVPARICFAPWSSYTELAPLVVDLPADILTAVHAVVVLNTAYKTRSGRWITDRIRISSKASWLVLIAALPLDWLALAAGVTMEICNWLRVLKLSLMVWYLRKSYKEQTSTLTTWKRIQHLAVTSAAVIHILCCGWFYIGSNYRFWFDDQAISWYYVAPSYEDISFEHDLWGMGEDSSVWARYLISFYWVASVTTANPMLGSVLPQNIVEILYSIVVMTVNLTLFRYVTGEVSALVMRSDEDLALSRSHLEGVDAFVKSNALPKELQDEIKEYSVQQSLTQSLKASTLLDGLSYALRVDVANNVCREHIENVALFAGLSDNLMDSIMVSLVEESFEPEEYLYRQHEVASSMFIIVSGSVEEVQESATSEEVTKTLRVGETSADVPFFFKMRHWQSARACKGHGTVVFRLPRDRLTNLLKMYPKEEEIISSSAMEIFASFRDAATHKSKSRAGSVASSSKRTATSEGEEEEDASMEDNSMAAESEVFDMMVGGGLRARIAAQTERRRADAIHVLCSGAAAGDVENLKQLLLSSTRPNDCDSLKRTALHVAAAEGNTDAVRLLLSMGADPTAKDAFQNTPLNDAVRGKHDDAAAVIRHWDPDAPEPTPEQLKKAKNKALMGEKEVDKVPPPLNYKVELPGAQAGVELCEAASVGDKESVMRLLNNGIDPNEADYDARTALHLASCEGHCSVVQLLLQKKADATAKDRFGWNALDDAVRHGHTAVQKLLRDSGAKLSVGDTGVRMCQAAADADADTLQVMIVNGVNPSEADYDARTALHLAASNGNVSILDLLLGLGEGLEVNPVDRIGGTPLEDAHRHGHKVAIQMLTDAGGVTGSGALEEVIEAQTKAQKTSAKRAREDLVKSSVAGSQEQREMQELEERLDELWTEIENLKSAMIEFQELLVTPDTGWRFLDATEDERRQQSAISHEFLSVVGEAVKNLNEQVIAVHKLLHEAGSLSRLSKMCRRVFDSVCVEVEEELLTAFKLCRLMGKVTREARRILDTRKISWVANRDKKKNRWKHLKGAMKLTNAFSAKNLRENRDKGEIDDLKSKARSALDNQDQNSSFKTRDQPVGLVRNLTEKNLQEQVSSAALKHSMSKKRLERNMNAKPKF